MQGIFAPLLSLHLLCTAVFLVLVRLSSIRIDEAPRLERKKERQLSPSVTER